MKKELDDALCRDFPILYKRRRMGPTESCFYWGFQCGDGWEPLIRRLSEKLEAILAALPENEREPLVADQVKEKFGGLRFSLVSIGPDEMHKLISDAEVESYRTCESCGAEGTRRGGSYVQVLCDECQANKINSRLLGKTWGVEG